jgi:hypothetical protein
MPATGELGTSGLHAPAWTCLRSDAEAAPATPTSGTATAPD